MVLASRTQEVDLDAWFGDVSSGAGNGKGTRMAVGMGTGDWAFKSRFAIRIPRGNLFDGITTAGSIAAFDIRLKTNSANAGIGGSVHFYLERGTTAFTEYQVVAGSNGIPAGANVNAYVATGGPASGEWGGPTRDATNRAEFSGSPAANTFIKVNALALGRWWLVNPGVTSLILVGVAADETVAAQRCTFSTRESGSPAYAELTLGATGTNRAPDQPTDVAVAYSANGTSFTVAGTYSDPDGDTSPKFEVIFSPD